MLWNESFVPCLYRCEYSCTFDWSFFYLLSSYFLGELEKCVEEPERLAQLFIKHVSLPGCQSILSNLLLSLTTYLFLLVCVSSNPPPMSVSVLVLVSLCFSSSSCSICICGLFARLSAMLPFNFSLLVSMLLLVYLHVLAGVCQTKHLFWPLFQAPFEWAD